MAIVVTDSCDVTLTSGYQMADVSGAYSDLGQAFTSDYTGTVNKARVDIRRYGDPGGTVSLKIYDEAHVTAYGTDSLPTGAAIATSTARPVTDFAIGSYSYYEFTFDDTVSLTQGEYYFLAIDPAFVSSDLTTNYLRIGAVNTPASHDGNVGVIAYGGSWTSAALDLRFTVWVTEDNTLTVNIAASNPAYHIASPKLTP